MKLKVDSLKRKQIDNHQTHQKRERVQINKIRNEKGVIITDTAEIQRTTRDYCTQACAAKTDSLGEMDRFLERYNLPKQNQEETENMNTIAITKIESVIKNLPTNKVQNQRASQANSTKHLELTPILLK